MSQRVIACQVVGEYITGDGVVIGAAGSHDEVIIELDFSRAGNTWDGTTRTATFTDALGLNPTNVLLTANLLEDGHEDVYLVPIPDIVKQTPGKIGLTVAGVTVDNGVETLRVATEVSPFRVLPNEMVTWDGAADVPASAAEQLQAQIDVLRPEIAAVAGNAATAATKAWEAAGSAGQAASSASQAANSAAQAANSAMNARADRQAIENLGADAVTLEAGAQATVSKTVSQGVATLHFGIPRGDKGDQGATGPQGPQGVQGPQGERGLNGAAVAADGIYAFNVDENGHLILHYTGEEAPDFSINASGHLILTL